jgi:C_GCAxxG_C_C family probable redox protein
MTGETTRASLRAAAIARAEASYLDDAHPYGCAETTFMTLKRAFGLDAPDDASAAMALNGGVAYSGGPCGAITGAALAVGLLAEQRIADHATAKVVARELVQGTMEAFQARYGSVDCRALIGYDLRSAGGHAAFIESGLWRDACLSQIRTVVGHLAALGDADAWADAISALGADVEG